MCYAVKSGVSQMFNKDAFVVILQDRPICALKLVYLMTNALKICAGDPEETARKTGRKFKWVLGKCGAELDQAV
jgi:hypothetical protein